MELRAERFLGPNYIDDEEEKSFESVEIDYEQLHSVEFEREKFKNIRSTAKMLAHIIDADTEVWYPPVFRTKFEVRNGYKQANERGARLEETEVFNLLFKCRGKLKADGIALMTFGPNGEEWIMLCPDDTNYRIEIEKKTYLDIARRLVFSGLMDSDFQSTLVQNFESLNLGTRCANSLIHEYGHVLQYRMWHNEGIDTRDLAALYAWFFEIGYAENVANRVPNFESMMDTDKIRFLKEGFVEDYRIGLNMGSQNGLFELPNVYCFRGDFELPDLMVEGVDIVKTTLKQFNTQQVQGNRQLSSEPDRVAIANEIMRNARDFRAGQDNPASLAGFFCSLTRVCLHNFQKNLVQILIIAPYLLRISPHHPSRHKGLKITWPVAAHLGNREKTNTVEWWCVKPIRARRGSGFCRTT